MSEPNANAIPSTRAANRSRTHKLTISAMLSGVAFLLMFIEFPIPALIPSFVKLDVSDLPELLAAFSLGPVYGIVVTFLKNLLLMSCGDYLTNRFCLNFPYFFHYGNCLNGRPKNFFGLSNVHFFPLLLLIVNSFCQNYRFCDGNDYLLLLQCHPCHLNICQKGFCVCLLRYIQKQYRDPAQNFSFFWTCVPLLPVHRRLHLLHRHHHSDPC